MTPVTVPALALIGMPSWAEMLVIAFVGLLLFGRRLPEVGRSLGRSIVEFKRGIRDVENDVDVASRRPPDHRLDRPESKPQLPNTSPRDHEPTHGE